ncbi:hypothetical protein RRG08_034837 [Elysia crispata]|uniref:Proton-coupled folate transporter n=1 Tax=Elysia crispata TaxID=231223 RepID=A0AAE1E1M0_9GAST|nr:hypothetical protein RRG08_034837 [Elysia crispata]
MGEESVYEHLISSSDRHSLVGQETLSPPDQQSKDEDGDRQKRRNMTILIICCSFSMLGYGIYTTAYSQWIYVRFEMDALGANFSKLNQSASKDPCFRGNHTDSPFKPLLMEAQSNSAHFSMLITLCSLVPSFFVNILLGAYSDQLGRRLIFIVPLAGNVARTAIVCAVAFWNLNVNFVLLAYTVHGLTGDYIAFIMAVFVYTADNTTKGKDRSFLMVFTQAVITICYYLSQLATGYYIEALGYVWPMVTGLGGLCVAFLIALFFLHETLDKSKQHNYNLPDERAILLGSQANWLREQRFRYGAGSMESPVLPIIRAILSRMVRTEERGSLFASIAVIETAAIAASGAGLNELYATSVDRWRGLTYFVIGCIVFFSAVLMLAYKSIIFRRQPQSAALKIEVSRQYEKINTSESDCEDIG